MNYLDTSSYKFKDAMIGTTAFSNFGSSSFTDCRTDEGIIVGLIDSIITNARVLTRSKHQGSPAIQQAFLDLQSDEDVKSLLY